MTYWLVYISIMVCIVLPLVVYITLKKHDEIAKRINDDLQQLNKIEREKIESEFKKFTTKKNKTKDTQ